MIQSKTNNKPDHLLFIAVTILVVGVLIVSGLYLYFYYVKREQVVIPELERNAPLSQEDAADYFPEEFFAFDRIGDLNTTKHSYRDGQGSEEQFVVYFDSSLEPSALFAQASDVFTSAGWNIVGQEQVSGRDIYVITGNKKGDRSQALYITITKPEEQPTRFTARVTVTQ
jgi:hypothetical protein